MKKVYLIIIPLLLQACTYSLKEQGDKAVASASYDNLIEAESYRSGSACQEEWRLNKMKREYDLPNGNFVHVYPGICGCLVHWEIDRKTKKVVGYKFEGENCPQ